ncbi:TetR family transcriptional regulator [Alcanivorax hongdengensis A-11-3]|uniref:TetR family transcriptional regulator n=1 Tax=Alcanivorax hongdengensis A-11-3 TaxID=1177179 RepID=L0W9X4_9GAMM|nr:TetR/AcrR family transcriptional regulator [Alcanivorax hongdengensis]EKF73553.1 TetR family transcriptional regulator [Alcanivorax hongdengensis A-11-3]
MPDQAMPSLSLGSELDFNNGDATYIKILDAGLAQFTEFGLRRTTMEDVASKAGVGRATAYRRFGDKHQLIQAVILRECQYQLGLIEAHLKTLDSPRDALLEAFVLAVTRAHVHPLLQRLLSSEPEDILPLLTLQWSRVIALFRVQLASQIRRAEEAGHVKVHDADQLAELMLRLMQSLVLSPDGLMNPADEASIRDMADRYLRPWLG